MSSPIKFFESSSLRVTSGSVRSKEDRADCKSTWKVSIPYQNTTYERKELTLAQTLSSTFSLASFSNKLLTSASFFPTFLPPPTGPTTAALAFEWEVEAPSTATAPFSAVEALEPRGAPDASNRAVRTRFRCLILGMLMCCCVVWTLEVNNFFCCCCAPARCRAWDNWTFYRCLSIWSF